MNNLLYHYATGAGLLGMLKDYTKDEPNIKLWASHYMYMNDPQEYEIGKKICTDIIDQIETELDIPENCRIKPFVESAGYRKALNEHLRTSNGQLICPYLISLSRAYDSLHMWDMYASNGNGLALGFNRLKLLEAHILPKECFYCDEDDIELMSKIKLDIRNLYIECSKEHPLQPIHKAINEGLYMPLYSRIHYIYTIICGHIGIRIKDGAYKLEKEVRITINSKDTSKILFRDRKGIIIPYIEYPIPFTCVENIVVGPTADFDRVRESILIFLNSKGIEWDSDKIIKSKVPYRI